MLLNIYGFIYIALHVRAYSSSLLSLIFDNYTSNEPQILFLIITKVIYVRGKDVLTQPSWTIEILSVLYFV